VVNRPRVLDPNLPRHAANRTPPALAVNSSIIGPTPLPLSSGRCSLQSGGGRKPQPGNRGLAVSPTGGKTLPHAERHQQATRLAASLRNTRETTHLPRLLSEVKPRSTFGFERACTWAHEVSHPDARTAAAARQGHGFGVVGAGLSGAVVGVLVVAMVPSGGGGTGGGTGAGSRFGWGGRSELHEPPGCGGALVNPCGAVAADQLGFCDLLGTRGARRTGLGDVEFADWALLGGVGFAGGGGERRFLST
jgi:hypothetical protein